MFDFLGNVLIDVVGLGVIALIYFAYLLTFGTSKYRRWAKEGREDQ